MAKPKQTVAARLDADVHEFIVERAATDGVTVSATINAMLLNVLKRAIAAESRKAGPKK